MEEFYIIHFGIGNVGKTFIDQLFSNTQKIKWESQVEILYCGMFGSKGGFFKQAGFTLSETKENSKNLSYPKITKPLDLLKKLPGSILEKTIIVDTTTSSEMFSTLSYCLKNGSYAVLSNKRPFAQTVNKFRILQKLGGNRLKFETTVGAGLPVIKALKELIATGDEIVEVSGCLSGTLGFLCSELEKGNSFSKSVAAAKEKGYTESDPREDLSGMDVARKAIILARMMGKEIEISDFSVGALFPPSYKKYSVVEFMEQVQELDAKYEKMFKDAAKQNKTLRYVVMISSKKVSVGLKEVSKDSPLGRLQGPDNMIVIKTKRYFDSPMVIQGPGAGLEVTAAGVFSDILSLAVGF